MPKKLYKRSSKKGKGSRLPLYKNKRDTSHDDDCVTPAETSAVVMEEESVTRSCKVPKTCYYDHVDSPVNVDSPDEASIASEDTPDDEEDEYDDDYDYELSYDDDNAGSDDNNTGSAADEEIDVGKILSESRQRRKDIELKLEQEGFLPYLRSTVGNKINPKSQIRIISNNIDWINWNHDKEPKYKTSLVPVNEIPDYIIYLVIYRYANLSSFLIFLENTRNNAAGTLIGKLNDISTAAKWMVLRRNNTPYNSTALTNFFDDMKGLQRNLRQQVFTVKEVSNSTNEVNIHEMQTAVTNRIPWALQIENETYITATVYKSFMGLLYTSFYAFGIQGRGGGIKTLPMSQQASLRTTGCALSNKFKTQYTLGIQPLTITKEMALLSRIYLDNLRPIAAANNPRAMDPDFPVFVTFNGIPENDIGK